MTRSEASAWTVDELAARAALALAESAGPVSGRVREVPDLRVIRYYASLGLLDRPGAMRGRTALYGKKHLAQLVAIKRLQARGLSLAEVQQHLAKLSEAALFDLARIPEEAESAELTTATPQSPAPSPERPPPGTGAHAPSTARRSSFWLSPTAEIAPAGAALKEQSAPSLASVALGARAMLVLDPARPLEEGDVEAIRAASAPLLKLLHKRGLIRPQDPEES